MADNKAPKDRSRNMSAIKSKDTKPEIYLRRRLFAKGFRYRKNVSSIQGHPDIYLAKYHTAIFVNGCFWHRHQGCKYAYNPKSRTEFWEKKFSRNVERDTEVKSILINSGYRCLVVWECTIREMQKNEEVAEEVLTRIVDFLFSETDYQEI